MGYGEKWSNWQCTERPSALAQSSSKFEMDFVRFQTGGLVRSDLMIHIELLNAYGWLGGNNWRRHLSVLMIRVENATRRAYIHVTLLFLVQQQQASYKDGTAIGYIALSMKNQRFDTDPS